MLRGSKHGLAVSSLVDIRHVAAEWRGLRLQISMERMAELILGINGVKKPSETGRSDWNVYWLSEEQVMYACLDAFLSFSMGKTQKVWNWTDSNR